MENARVYKTNKQRKHKTDRAKAYRTHKTD